MTSRATPSTGRARPAPKIASTASAAPSRTAGDSGSTGPGQRAPPRASPCSLALSPSRASRTAQPRSARIRAATKPSPPLLPGPHNTATGRGGKAPRDRIGDREPRLFHQLDAGDAAGDRQPVGIRPSVAASAARVCASLPGRSSSSHDVSDAAAKPNLDAPPAKLYVPPSAAGVAQLVRAPDCGSGCRRFESDHSPQSHESINLERVRQAQLIRAFGQPFPGTAGTGRVSLHAVRLSHPVPGLAAATGACARLRVRSRHACRLLEPR